MIGYKYFSDNNFRWRLHQQAIVPLTMPHRSPKITTTSARAFLFKEKKFLLRWDEEFDDHQDGEWWHVIKDEKEDISLYKKKVRYMIRKGCESYSAKICDRTFIEENAYAVYEKAYTRYETFEKMETKSSFQENIHTLPKETEFWGVFDNNTDELVAFSENLVSENACFYLTMWCTPAALKKFVSYTLFHKMNNHYLNNKQLSYVSDGARSISHESNIHEFLLSKFRFRKAYSKLRIVYFPGFQTVIAVLFPMRNLFKKLSHPISKKTHILLYQESIRRSCKSLKSPHEK